MGTSGRPPKGEFTGKSSVFTTRIRPDTRAHLEAAAAASGRTLSQEVEHRLHRSFIEDRDVVTAFGSRRNFAIMRMAAATIEPIESAWAKEIPWTDDPYLFDQVTKAINQVLELIRPNTGADNGESRPDFAFKVSAADLVDAVKDAKPTSYDLEPKARLASRLQSDLGEDIVKRARRGKKTIGTISDELRPFADIARAEGASVMDVYRREVTASKQVTGSGKKGRRS